MDPSREELIFKAKLADNAERYDEMADVMIQVSEVVVGGGGGGSGGRGRGRDGGGGGGGDVEIDVVSFFCRLDLWGFN